MYICFFFAAREKVPCVYARCTLSFASLFAYANVLLAGELSAVLSCKKDGFVSLICGAGVGGILKVLTEAAYARGLYGREWRDWIM